MRILIDTSVLIRIRDQSSSHHAQAWQAIRRLRNERRPLCVCTQVLVEYWVVASRPTDVSGLGLSVQDVLEDLGFFDVLFDFVDDPPNTFSRWRSLVETHSVSGRPAHDARLAAFMLEVGINDILTLNLDHFRRFAGINCVEVSSTGG